MPLLTLPPEILLDIASILDLNSINSLVLSCHYLNHHLTHALYSFPLRRHETARRYGPGALLSAATRRDTYTVEKMLKWGILEHFDWWGSRDLEMWLLSTQDEARALETLLRCGMDPVAPFVRRPAPLLDRAAAAGITPVVRALLASPGATPIPRRHGTPYKPALISAVQRGFVDIVEILCGDERVNVNIVDGAQEVSVLHLAVQIGNPEIVRCLLRRNDINVDTRSPSGETPLCWAAREGNLAIVRLLLEEGGAGVNLSGGLTKYPNPGTPPADERLCLLHTPLHFAAIGGHLSVVQFLAEWEGVNINALDVEGDTPLDHAVRCRHRKMVQVLKDNGAIGGRYGKRRQLRRHAMALRGFGCFSRNV